MKAWIVSDIDGEIFLYIRKPTKGFSVWAPTAIDCKRIYNSDLPEGVNPQWSDDEPIEVELKIEKV